MPKRNTTAIGLCKKIFFYLMLIIIWELVYRVGVDFLGIWKPSTLPSPLAVFKTLLNLIVGNTLGAALVASLRRLLIGFSISLVIGVVTGLTIVRFKYLDENLSELILGLQTLPNICWVPFAILWYGLSESAIIFVIAVGSTFAISLAIETGIKNVSPLYIQAAQTMGASGINIYRHVILPASLPSIISGMKQGWSFAWRGLIAGEMLSATKGLGQVLTQGRDLSDISQVTAVMIVIIVLGLVVDKLIFGRMELNIRQKWGLDRT